MDSRPQMGPGGTRRLDTIFNLGLLSEDSIAEPNGPAQARRANDAGMTTAARTRRCLEPDGWALRLRSWD
jgi:hypothetical protein